MSGVDRLCLAFPILECDRLPSGAMTAQKLTTGPWLECGQLQGKTTVPEPPLEVVMVDRAPGLEAALVARWGDDHRDMIYAETAVGVEKRRKAFLRGAILSGS